MEYGSHLSPRYDPARERAWHLSILTGQGMTGCAVHSVEDGGAVALFWSIGDAVLKAPELPDHPFTVSFVSLPEWSTLVPDGALEPGTGSQHLALVHGSVPSGAMRDEAVSSLGATCIYVHDDREEHTVLQRFPHARALPMQGLMVRCASALGADGEAILLHRGADRLVIAIVRNGNLLLSNTYPCRSAHDLLYFTLLALERTALAPSEVRLYHGGTHLSEAERDLVARYVLHCEPAARLPWEPEQAVPEGAAHRWMAALEQFACVS